MTPKFLPLLFAFLLILTVAVPNEAATRVGGWTPIRDVQSPEVVRIGKFAILEHNKEAKTDLQFETVVRGETQVVAGTNYRLTISAKDGRSGESRNYVAVVWAKLSNTLQLTSFKSA